MFEKQLSQLEMTQTTHAQGQTTQLCLFEQLLAWKFTRVGFFEHSGQTALSMYLRQGYVVSSVLKETCAST